jgi:hypothetical protein
MEKIDNEEVVKALEGIVTKFKDEISPLAVEFSIQLTSMFFKYSTNNEEKNNKAGDSDDEDESKLLRFN